MKPFNYLIPSCLEEAIALRRSRGERASFIAGGTEIVPRMARHRLEFDCLIELSRVRELAVFARDEAGLRIGAMTTHAAVERSEPVLRGWPALAEACGSIREQQIRNLGTVGGNLAYAVPSADLMPPLLVFDASVEIRGALGQRSVPISQFVIAPYRSCLDDGDIVVEIRLPPVGEDLGSAYCKVTKFRGFGLPVASVAAALVVRGGRIRDARVALGAGASTARRVAEAERFLEGRPPEAEVLREAGARVSAAAEPREASIRASGDYKRAVLGPLTARALGLAVRRSMSRSGAGEAC